MKRNILSLLSILTLFFTVSCTDTRLDNIASPTVYIPQSGEIEQIVYKTGEPFVFQLGVYKAGFQNVEASASINVMSVTELEAYNAKYNTAYKRLPDNCFQLKNQSINFSKESRLEYSLVHVDYNAIATLSDFDSENTRQYVIPVNITQASLATNENKAVSLIKPILREPLIYFRNTSSKVTIEASAGEDNYKSALSLRVDFANTWDITVDLLVDAELVDTYNTQNEVNYSLLPANTYTLSPNPVTLSQGNQKAEITVSLDAEKIDYDDFILPVSISKTSKFSADATRKTHYLHISKPAERFDRTKWTIAGVSSEESQGEGAGNGVGKCVLDGDPATFWHSQWYGGTGQLPHFITIDLQNELLVTSVDLQRRPNNRDTKAGKFYISSDNTTFTQIGTFEMAEVNEAQTFKVTSTRGRMQFGRYLNLNLFLPC